MYSQYLRGEPGSWRIPCASYSELHSRFRGYVYNGVTFIHLYIDSYIDSEMAGFPGHGSMEVEFLDLETRPLVKGRLELNFEGVIAHSGLDLSRMRA